MTTDADVSPADGSGSATRRFVIVASAGAGSSGVDAVEGAVSVLGGGADVSVAWTDGPEQLDELLPGLDPATTVVSAGGDGSLHHLVGALDRHGRLDLAVGVLPLGTGNDLARAIGLPPDDVVAAARALAAAPVRPVDLLDGPAGPVVNVVHLGIGAVAARRATPLKRWLRAAAYPVGAVVAGASVSSWTTTVEVDGSTLVAAERVLVVAVANGPTVGGGAVVAEHASIDDGVLDVVVVPDAARRPGRARLGWQARGGLDEVAGVRRARGAEVTVTVEGGDLPGNADGELVDARRSWTYRVRPAALRLLVPGPEAVDRV